MGNPSVEIVEKNGQFAVLVTENDEVTETTYDFLKHAQAFADGQRMRLGESKLAHPKLSKLGIREV